MKPGILMFLIIVCLFLHTVVSGQTDVAGPVSIDDTTQNDEYEYKLIVMEPGYESYLVLQPPMELYSEHYYKIWNQRYVTEWNIRYQMGPRRELYENEIFYDPMNNPPNIGRGPVKRFIGYN